VAGASRIADPALWALELGAAAQMSFVRLHQQVRAPKGSTAMSAPKLDITPSVKNHIETLVALAGLLERVEKTPAKAVGADQYRTLVRQVQAALAEEMPDAARQAVLGAYPATAELYENQHYAQSGLSRSPLDVSVASEKLASTLLAKVTAASRRSGGAPAP